MLYGNFHNSRVVCSTVCNNEDLAGQHAVVEQRFSGIWTYYKRLRVTPLPLRFGQKLNLGSRLKESFPNL